MTDVRLTATNPEDSSVVPVACNAKGELKLEEPIALPEFDGNLDGDLIVSGKVGIGTDNPQAKLDVDGGAVFAGGKAGFTAEGNLWCTTVRGDTVILDATSGGMGSWQDYTPPTRREIIEQKVHDIKDASLKPSQELPEGTDIPES